MQLVDPGTNLIIGRGTSILQADSVTINNGGTIRLAGGTPVVVEETGNGNLAVNAGGTLSGNGAINLTDTVAAAVPSLIMRVEPSHFEIVCAPAGELPD